MVLNPTFQTSHGKPSHATRNGNRTIHPRHGVALFTTADAGTGKVRMVATLMVVGPGFSLASQPLTDTVMIALPVEDAGIGSAVGDGSVWSNSLRRSS